MIQIMPKKWENADETEDDKDKKDEDEEEDEFFDDKEE